jgi:hypothetical protein
VRCCAEQQISFTRSRPYQRQGTCHLEQKNWSIVRRLVGYARFEHFALLALNRVQALARDYVNFLQRVLKLTEKQREGAKVTKRYDQARTPYRRPLATGVLSADATATLAARYQTLHLVRLKLEHEAAQQALSAAAIREHPPIRQRFGLEIISS